MVALEGSARMRIPIVIVAITSLCLSVLTSAAQSTPFRLTAVHRNLSYVTSGHPRQTLDLYLPTPPAVRTWQKPPANGYQTKLPLVIWIFGGAFLVGSKDDTVPLELLPQGYAVASVGYRLSSDAKFPAQVEDCKAAIRWLRANAARFALDPERFGVFGESAGGYLAAMLGTTGDVKEFDVGEYLDHSSRVQAVIDFYGPTDFLQNASAVASAKTPEAMLIGGAVLENKDKAAKANPIAYVTRDDPPFLVVHGDSDKLVPYNQSELLEAALKKVNVPVTFHSVKGGGHGGFSDDRIGPMVTKFFADHLLGPSRR
jgi:acetyl esterase/lipase